MNEPIRRVLASIDDEERALAALLKAEKDLLSLLLPEQFDQLAPFLQKKIIRFIGSFLRIVDAVLRIEQQLTERAEITVQFHESFAGGAGADGSNIPAHGESGGWTSADRLLQIAASLIPSFPPGKSAMQKEEKLAADAIVLRILRLWLELEWTILRRETFMGASEKRNPALASARERLVRAVENYTFSDFIRNVEARQLLNMMKELLDLRQNGLVAPGQKNPPWIAPSAKIRSSAQRE